MYSYSLRGVCLAKVALIRKRAVVPVKYNLEWPEGIDDLSIELRCFRASHKVDAGGLGQAGHFKRAALLIWGSHNKRKEFIWHPWADKMLEHSCKWQYLSVSGPGNIGKSDFFAIWTLINWLCDPINTMVIVTSTTVSSAKKRIWGSIVDYYSAADHMPGKLVDSMGIIRTISADGRKISDKAGISLVAGEDSQDKASADKLDGCHNKRVIMVGDEFPKLSHALLKFAKGNLAKNPWFQFIGIGNPASKYDPHGLISEPKGGWNSISENDYEWETKLGYAIRFDSYQSPNVLTGRVIYPFLPTCETIRSSEEANGPDSLEHWSQCRGFWPPEGSDPECVYSEADLVDGGVTETHVDWAGGTTCLAVLDPARGSGGDAYKAALALLGHTKSGQRVLLVTSTTEFFDSKSDPDPIIIQISKQFVAFCREHGVSPENVGYDSTGAAGEIGGVITYMFNNAVLHAVDFNGKPSDLPHGVDQKPCSELYDRRVTELWMVMKDFIRSGQIKGLTTDIIEDLLARKETTGKLGQTSTKRSVESKRVMKKRIKRSPDSGDCLALLCDLCRTKYDFRSEIAVIANKNAEAEWERMSREAASANTTAMPMHLQDFAQQQQDGELVGAWPEPQEEVDLGFFP
jgi:hypothetical protein